MSELAEEFLQVVSRKKKTRKETEQSLGRNFKERAQFFAISKLFLRIYLEGSEFVARGVLKVLSYHSFYAVQS